MLHRVHLRRSGEQEMGQGRLWNREWRLMLLVLLRAVQRFELTGELAGQGMRRRWRNERRRASGAGGQERGWPAWNCPSLQNAGVKRMRRGLNKACGA